MTKTFTTYLLRFPQALKAAVEQRSRADGVSINQFMVMAVAEKIAAMNAAEYLAERAREADMEVFDRILGRTGGEPPHPDDKIENAP